MAKIVENTYRSVNIALVNELKIVADSVGIDIYEVIDAASSKPFGYHPFYPGPGIGGHCIPIDPYYLLWKAEKMQVELSVVKQASKVNNSMPDFVISKILFNLSNEKVLIEKSKILIIGLSYKKIQMI